MQDLLIDGVFGNDYFYEDASAFNIFRVNLISNDSGVSQRVYDEHGTPTRRLGRHDRRTTLRDTALGYIYSGSWAHCWLEGGANTGTLVNDALDTWVPDWDLAVVILNEPGFGGCGGGGFQVVTLGATWAVMAHEFGHGAGGLADEYCQPGTYTGGEPGAVNVTANSNRATLKWRQVRQSEHAGPDGHQPEPRQRRLHRATTRAPSPPTGAAIQTSACSRARSTQTPASTARSSTAGCAATRRRTAPSATPR